jgi:hypothetical protein
MMSAVLTDDGLRDGQAQAGSVGAAADHREVHALQHVVGNAGSVVDDVQLHHEAVKMAADGELAVDPGAHGDGRAGSLLRWPVRRWRRC